MTRVAIPLVAAVLALLGASSAESRPTAGPGYDFSGLQVSYDSPPFPDARGRSTVDFAGFVCGDPVAGVWGITMTLTFEGDTDTAEVFAEFGAENPAQVFTHTFELNGEEKGRIDIALSLGPGPSRTITPQWVVSGDIVNVAATPSQVPIVARTLNDCITASPPPSPPPPAPPAGTIATGGPSPGRPPGTVKLPGSNRFVPIKDGQPLPSGTIVDVSKGKGIRLTEAGGNPLDIYGEKDGVPSQAKLVRATGFVELQLAGGSFKGCAKRLAAAAGKTAKPVRRLWAKGKGKFRTKGRYVSATIRGTWWQTADFCDRSVVTVKEGSVLARNLVTKKTKVVTKGKSYSANR